MPIELEFLKNKSKSEIGYLDPEIANEGVGTFEYANGDDITWSPPAVRQSIPDYSTIVPIKKYFGRHGYQVWPCWLYHPDEPARIVRNQEEAMQYGVVYRKTTADEQMKFGLTAMFDWDEKTLWRPKPHANTLKFDPSNPGTGKTYIATEVGALAAQNSLVQSLIPTVTAAVVAAMKSSGTASAPPAVDPAQWEAFLQFQAWQKSSQAVDLVNKDNALASNYADLNASVEQANADSEEERALWEAEAISKGIKVDGRWSLQRLISEVNKAS